ncbi:TOBE domain-containing protein [Streptomyces flavochromogenes]|uniref:TOBE domain-containing protein n=1 Tax=Streptomyces flavochromogenes TaxID=68199 RepID=UPI00099C12BD
MADRVAVLNAGRLEQCAAPAELYRRPATPFVAEFVGTMNRLPGVLMDSGEVEVAGTRLPVDGEDPKLREVDVLVRPENVTVTGAADGETTVVSTSFLGSVTRVHLDHAGTRVKADLSSREATALTPGARVTLGLAPHPALVAPRAER